MGRNLPEELYLPVFHFGQLSILASTRARIFALFEIGENMTDEDEVGCMGSFRCYVSH